MQLFYFMITTCKGNEYIKLQQTQKIAIEELRWTNKDNNYYWMVFICSS